MPTQSLRESIPWREFVKILASEAKLSLAEFDKLKILLGIQISINLCFLIYICIAAKPEGSLPSEEPKVSLERFSQILTWFGPFFLPPNSTPILSEIKSLLSNVWFHNDISKDLAEKRYLCYFNGI